MTGRLVKLLLAAAVVGLVAGYVFGLRSPNGAKRLKVVEATAKLESAESGLGLADEDGGDLQFGFHVPTIHWTDATASGAGHPPCLRVEGRKAKVEIGYLALHTPTGATYEDQALWIRCL